MEEINKVISNKELSNRFIKLCDKNWKIKSMSKGLNGTPKEIIDNWFEPTRHMLLKMLNIKENSNYKFVYHDL